MHLTCLLYLMDVSAGALRYCLSFEDSLHLDGRVDIGSGYSFQGLTFSGSCRLPVALSGTFELMLPLRYDMVGCA
jgi:hypothetical protein